MKTNYSLLLLALGALFLLSCSKDEEVIDEVWKSDNEKAFNELTYNPAYSRIQSESKMGHIFYKVIKEGTGNQPIYYTSHVKMYYTGSLIDGTVFDRAEHPDKLAVEFQVSQVVDGWGAALQHMKEGDRWEVWIPQELGYGSSAQTNIPAYSTLRFEMEVVKVWGIEEK
ncbi:MAG: FKBP-type peptidyl-prolyl cis-trans isomerase [Tannerellaceae bacterium]|jgi:peptidylprolyl isomerase/FKBP-type peptidyl-prolyl cis-trans isomerase FklB|nr:FKBP-type peptidyl-prolyl cis-trans isomerase [Tannerellaceae bacterium]